MYDLTVMLVGLIDHDRGYMWMAPGNAATNLTLALVPLLQAEEAARASEPQAAKDRSVLDISGEEAFLRRARYKLYGHSTQSIFAIVGAVATVAYR